MKRENKKIKKTIFASVILSVIGLVVGFSACGGGGNNGGGTNPNAGFNLQLYATTGNFNIQTGALANGQFLSGNAQTTGTVENFTNLQIQGVGITPVASAKAPATWRFIYPSSFTVFTLCQVALVVDKNVSRGETTPLLCPSVPLANFEATPNVIDASDPPLTVTLTGKGIENLYGQPTVSLYDQQGNFISSTSSGNNLLFDGSDISGVQIPVPDLSAAPTGNYTLTVSNANGDGTLTLVGATPITVYGIIIILPDDPCGLTPNNPCNY